MDEQILDSVKEVLTQARDEMRANMQAKDVNASGRTSDSIRVEVYDEGVRLMGGLGGNHRVEAPFSLMQRDTAPIPTLEFGRAGGNVPRGFYYIIKQWTREKGLQFTSESARSTFAYFVSEKIKREGTNRHEHHEDVYSTPVDKAKDAIKDMFARSIANTVRGAIAGDMTSLQGAFTR